MSFNETGLDGSHFQTLTDAAQVFAHGERFASWKFTEGLTFVDSSAPSATQRLATAGIKTGGYHFAQPGSAADQAEFFKSRATAVLGSGHLWPMLDMEDSGLQLSIAMEHIHGNREYYNMNNHRGLVLDRGADGLMATAKLAEAMYHTSTFANGVIPFWHMYSHSERQEVKRQARFMGMRRGSPGAKRSMIAKAAAQSANGFIMSFFDALDVEGMINYGNLTWWQTIFHPTSWGNRNIVGAIARYNGDPGNPGFVYDKMGIHQYADDRVIPGFAAPLDGDACFNGYHLTDLLLGGTTPVSSTEPTNDLDPGKLSDDGLAMMARLISVHRNTATVGAAGWSNTPAAIAPEVNGIAKAFAGVVATQAQHTAALQALGLKLDADIALDTDQKNTLADVTANLVTLQNTIANPEVELTEVQVQQGFSQVAKQLEAFLGNGVTVTINPPKTGA